MNDQVNPSIARLSARRTSNRRRVGGSTARRVGLRRFQAVGRRDTSALKPLVMELTHPPLERE